MIKQEYKYSELTSRIIGCAMTVQVTVTIHDPVEKQNHSSW